MLLLTRIVEWDPFAFGLLLLVAQLVVYEIGFQIGHWHAARTAAKKEGVAIFAQSVLALLAFVLALTLSFANGQFTATRDGTLAEANAIDDAWLTAKAIGGAEGDTITRLLERYAELRIAFIKAPDEAAVLGRITQETDALRSEIWRSVTTLLRKEPSRPVVALLASLNEVFSATTAEQFHFEQRIPPEIFSLLIMLTLLGMLILGYELASRGPPMRTLAAVLALVWTLVIVDIISLGWPRIGGVPPTAQAYEWALEGIRTGGAGAGSALQAPATPALP